MSLDFSSTEVVIGDAYSSKHTHVHHPLHAFEQHHRSVPAIRCRQITCTTTKDGKIVISLITLPDVTPLTSVFVGHRNQDRQLEPSCRRYSARGHDRQYPRPSSSRSTPPELFLILSNYLIRLFPHDNSLIPTSSSSKRTHSAHTRTCLPSSSPIHPQPLCLWPCTISIPESPHLILPLPSHQFPSVHSTHRMP